MERIAESHQDYFYDIENANKYLEIGCGPGILTQIIAKQHPDVEIIANDISPEMNKLARQDLAEDLKSRIKYTISEQLALDANYFENLSKGQAPEYLYIGCSDSRVTPETMMGIKPGEVFVHRNIANLVLNTDLSAMSIINYAVEHLKVNHIIVCGHYYCGGVQAAMQPSDMGILNPWLRNIRDVYRLHKTELDQIDNEEEQYKRLIELNVQEQCVMC